MCTPFDGNEDVDVVGMKDSASSGIEQFLPFEDTSFHVLAFREGSSLRGAAMLGRRYQSAVRRPGTPRIA